MERNPISNQLRKRCFKKKCSPILSSVSFFICALQNQ